MTVHQLRYTGDHATVFQTGNVGLVEPGDEFAVPDELLIRFMRRPDVSHAGECPAPPCRCGEDLQPEPEPEGVPEASYPASASQDADTSGAGRSGRRGRSGASNGTTETGNTGIP
jgi:hypothetical protein